MTGGDRVTDTPRSLKGRVVVVVVGGGGMGGGERLEGGKGGGVVRGGKTGRQERLRCRIHTKCLYLQGRIQDFRKGGSR